jgi:hypothetical protein
VTPLYRALCEAALNEFGVLEPSVSATGVFRDELGDLLQADDGVALILQALAFADTATGATIGREVVKALAQQTGIEGLEARYEVQCSSSHWLSSDAVEDALHRVVHAFAVQRRI